MQINIEKLEKLTLEADKIFLDPEGEEVLLQLIEIQEQVEQAIKTAKQVLSAKALSLDANFKSLSSDKVKVYYRSYGAKYFVDEKNIEYAPEQLFTTQAGIIVPNHNTISTLETELQKYGAKLKETGGKFVKKDFNRVVNGEAVDAWVKANRSMPVGIIENIKRPASLTFGKKGRKNG